MFAATYLLKKKTNKVMPSDKSVGRAMRPLN